MPQQENSPQKPKAPGAPKGQFECSPRPLEPVIPPGAGASGVTLAPVSQSSNIQPIDNPVRDRNAQIQDLLDSAKFSSPNQDRPPVRPAAPSQSSEALRSSRTIVFNESLISLKKNKSRSTISFVDSNDTHLPKRHDLLSGPPLSGGNATPLGRRKYRAASAYERPLEDSDAHSAGFGISNFNPLQGAPGKLELPPFPGFNVAATKGLVRSGSLSDDIDSFKRTASEQHDGADPESIIAPVALTPRRTLSYNKRNRVVRPSSAGSSVTDKPSRKRASIDAGKSRITPIKSTNRRAGATKEDGRDERTSLLPPNPKGYLTDSPPKASIIDAGKSFYETVDRKNFRDAGASHRRGKSLPAPKFKLPDLDDHPIAPQTPKRKEYGDFRFENRTPGTPVEGTVASTIPHKRDKNQRTNGPLLSIDQALNGSQDPEAVNLNDDDDEPIRSSTAQETREALQQMSYFQDPIPTNEQEEKLQAGRGRKKKQLVGTKASDIPTSETPTTDSKKTPAKDKRKSVTPRGRLITIPASLGLSQTKSRLNNYKKLVFNMMYMILFPSNSRRSGGAQVFEGTRPITEDLTKAIGGLYKFGTPITVMNDWRRGFRCGMRRLEFKVGQPTRPTSTRTVCACCLKFEHPFASIRFFGKECLNKRDTDLEYVVKTGWDSQLMEDNMSKDHGEDETHAYNLGEGCFEKIKLHHRLKHFERKIWRALHDTLDNRGLMEETRPTEDRRSIYSSTKYRFGSEKASTIAASTFESYVSESDCPIASEIRELELYLTLADTLHNKEKEAVQNQRSGAARGEPTEAEQTAYQESDSD